MSHYLSRQKSHRETRNSQAAAAGAVMKTPGSPPPLIESDDEEADDLVIPPDVDQSLVQAIRVVMRQEMKGFNKKTRQHAQQTELSQINC